MKGFSIPNISIPSISIPKISITEKVDAGMIKSAISSAIPNLSSITDGLDIEGIASKTLSDAMADGIDIPAELSNLIK